MRKSGNKIAQRGLVLTGVLAIVALVAGACSDSGDSPMAAVRTRDFEPVMVTGPVQGGSGNILLRAPQDLATHGYQEEEFFIEGMATSYRPVGELTGDGQWDVEPDDAAAYRTRMIVRRPVDPADFSGVVVVEWLNVSGGGDDSPDWHFLNAEYIREGHAWVGVSVQAVGVIGGGRFSLRKSLVETDPARYGSLMHPGDAFAYDIFSQAGEALWSPDGPDPLGDLNPTYLIAAGESQSAIFMTTYINAVHPLVHVYDGFLVHARSGSAPGIGGAAVPGAVRIRTDLAEPVFTFLTETEVSFGGYVAARQPDTDTVRAWEAAGTAHGDASGLAALEDQLAADGLLAPGSSITDLLGCAGTVNEGPQRELVVAALHHLVDWVRAGTPPPVAHPIETLDGVIVRDQFGNALGGVRTPLVDVPVATYVESVSGDGLCKQLFGTTIPLPDATLASLYPTHADYVDAFTASADEAVKAGFLLRNEADAMVDEARERNIGQ